MFKDIFTFQQFGLDIQCLPQRWIAESQVEMNADIYKSYIMHFVYINIYIYICRYFVIHINLVCNMSIAMETAKSNWEFYGFERDEWTWILERYIWLKSMYMCNLESEFEAKCSGLGLDAKTHHTVEYLYWARQRKFSGVSPNFGEEIQVSKYILLAYQRPVVARLVGEWWCWSPPPRSAPCIDTARCPRPVNKSYSSIEKICSQAKLTSWKEYEFQWKLYIF